jgi:hypothetical protein
MVSREPDEYHMDFWDAMFSLESKETIPNWEQFQKEFIADGKPSLKLFYIEINF